MPHWRYRRIKKKNYTDEHALDPNLLDAYIKETVSSFFLFFVMIGPIVYKTHFKGENQEDETTSDKEEDTYVRMLKNYKIRQQKMQMKREDNQK